jgi:hypothetical protein
MLKPLAKSATANITRKSTRDAIVTGWKLGVRINKRTLGILVAII